MFHFQFFREKDAVGPQRTLHQVSMLCPISCGQRRGGGQTWTGSPWSWGLQGAGHIWPVGHSLLTYGLHYSHPNINFFIPYTLRGQQI